MVPEREVGCIQVPMYPTGCRASVRWLMIRVRRGGGVGQVAHDQGEEGRGRGSGGS